jgi:hypothetical protein
MAGATASTSSLPRLENGPGDGYPNLYTAFLWRFVFATGPPDETIVP